MADSHPRAPGLVWRKLKNGIEEGRWRARADLVERGYPMKGLRVWSSESLPTADDWKIIASQCQDMQDDMLAWARGVDPAQVVGFDGTIKTLIRCYLTDPVSGYRKGRYRTRLYYDGLCRRIERDHGAELVANIKVREAVLWHDQWSVSGVTMAHSLMGMLRTLVGFGADFLENAECARVAGMLHRRKFEMAKRRKEHLTADQALAVIAKAHETGWHSIALAQAFQFDVMLRQRDGIGEWVPVAEKELSDVTHEGRKWLRGLRWSEIDDNLILRHTTSKRLKDIEVDLKLAPMVMDELARFKGVLPTSGPVVICEYTGRPWTDGEFRRQWRKLADACGIPKTVRNMDSRAGAISEATDAGADLHHVQHAATHSDISTTQGYSRNSVEKIAGVMRLRAEHRNKK